MHTLPLIIILSQMGRFTKNALPHRIFILQPEMQWVGRDAPTQLWISSKINPWDLSEKKYTVHFVWLYLSHKSIRRFIVTLSPTLVCFSVGRYTHFLNTFLAIPVLEMA